MRFKLALAASAALLFISLSSRATDWKAEKLENVTPI